MCVILDFYIRQAFSFFLSDFNLVHKVSSAISYFCVSQTSNKYDIIYLTKLSNVIAFVCPFE